MADFTPISFGRPRIPSARANALRERDAQTDALLDRRAYAPPPRPRANFIPTPAELQQLITRAVEALKNGIYWDRGSILNIIL